MVSIIIDDFYYFQDDGSFVLFDNDTEMEVYSELNLRPDLYSADQWLLLGIGIDTKTSTVYMIADDGAVVSFFTC